MSNYEKGVPLIDEHFFGASSRTEKDELLSVEITEKCLLPNTEETWNKAWKNIVSNRQFVLLWKIKF